VPEFDMAGAFNPVVKNGKLYGRGACDMKGGITAMLLVLEELVRRGEERDVVFAFVVDEEMYGRGAAELIASGTRAEICVITEPTNMQICIGNASCLQFKLKAYGQSSHGAARIDTNAIRILVRAYEKIEKRLSEELAVENTKYPMKPIINIGRIEGGYGAWVVPPTAEADILIHMHPSITYEEAHEKLMQIVSETSAEMGIEIEAQPTHGCDGYILEQSRYYENLAKAHNETTGEEPRIGIIEAETDANALYHKGRIPCIIYGPGDIKYAHSSREHINLHDVIKAAKTLLRFIELEG